MPAEFSTTVSLVPVCPDRGVESSYHWYLYGDVPPDADAVNVADSPVVNDADVGVTETVNGVG